MAKAYLVVRSVVADEASRAAFDRWYSKEHLPDAVRDFGVKRGWRGWSRTDPSAHLAFYEFPDAAAVQRAQASDATRALVAEFDRAFPKVTRTREIIEVADEIGSAA